MVFFIDDIPHTIAEGHGDAELSFIDGTARNTGIPGSTTLTLRVLLSPPSGYG